MRTMLFALLLAVAGPAAPQSAPSQPPSQPQTPPQTPEARPTTGETRLNLKLDNAARFAVEEPAERSAPNLPSLGAGARTAPVENIPSSRPFPIDSQRPNQ